MIQIYKKIKEIESDLTVGRVLIRPSGTENLIRVMVESESKETAQKYASDISKLFE
jgi:phosphoglucosamine mutase